MTAVPKHVKDTQQASARKNLNDYSNPNKKKFIPLAN
jgi:hypothetical protein